MASVDESSRPTRAASATSPPWTQHATDVAAALGTDLAFGLTADEAARRRERFGRNQLDASPPVPAWRKLLAQLTDPLVYLLAGAVVISFIAWLLEGREGLPFEVIVITVIVLANAVLGYVQEARAEEAVAALQRMAARDGLGRARRPRAAHPRRRPRPG